MASSQIPGGDVTIAMLQSINQYALGLTAGYLIDILMDQVMVADDNVVGRSVKQVVQAGLNGVMLAFLLKGIHGVTPAVGYRDPSGGYLLVIGLIQGQYCFMANGKDLIKGLGAFVKEYMNSTNGSTEIASSSAAPTSTY